MHRVPKIEKIVIDETIKYQVSDHKFMQKADDVVKSLLHEAEGNVHDALYRLEVYMKNAGEELKNNKSLQKAKKKLEKMVKH